ncbi:unnamed protein product [Prunus armeniaca]
MDKLPLIHRLLNRWCLMLMDILSNKTIGCGTRTGELYYMDLARDSEAKAGQAFKIGGANVEKQTDEIFQVLSVTFENWPRAIPFPLSSNNSSVLFSLVHSKVWRSAKVVTLAGAR